MIVLGYKAATEQFAPNQLLDWAVEAEQAGFDAIDASDHFHPWRDDDVHCSFVWSWLGALGARSRQVYFGTGVTCPTLRYNPAVIAQASATLAVMFPGRFWLGVGTGEALNETATTGLWPSYPERYERLVEAVQVIRRLWNGERLTFRGRYYQTRDAYLYDRPKQPIPLYIAGSGEDAARLAGHDGDGWITTGGAGSLDHYQHKLIPAVDRGARAAGRDSSQVLRAVELAVVVAPNQEAGLKEARLWTGSMYPNRAKYGVYDPRDMQRVGKLIPDQEIASHWFISGDPDEHVQLAERYLDLGFTHLFFHAPGPNQRAFIQFYGQNVLPKLRQRYGQAQRPAA
jgi:coenzyme F420-dependent glucose-6-phosphate dehydrogenase